MGMFDISGTGSRQKPMYADDLYAAGQNMFADQMAPGIKRMTGYESPKRKAMAIAGKADLSSMSSIQDTYKQLQQINAEMASAWLKDTMSNYNAGTQRMTAENARLTAMSKTPTKRETKFDQATGQLRYVDNGKVVPGFEQVKPSGSNDDKDSDLPQMTKVTYEQIQEDINNVFDYSVWDLTSPDAPGGISERQLINFIFGYEQITNTGRAEIIEGIKNKTIDPTKPIPKKTSTTAQSPNSSSVGFIPTPAMPK